MSGIKLICFSCESEATRKIEFGWKEIAYFHWRSFWIRRFWKKTKYNSLARHNSKICHRMLQSKLTEWNTNISDRVQYNTVEVRTGSTLYNRDIAKTGRYTFVKGLLLCFIEQSQKLSHDGSKRWQDYTTIACIFQLVLWYWYLPLDITKEQATLCFLKQRMCWASRLEIFDARYWFDTNLMYFCTGI
jgi:hypothetical protein